MESIAPAPAASYLALTEVSRIIASRRTLSDLFHDLAEHLHRLLNFHYLSVVLYDAAHDVMRTHILEMAGHGMRQPDDIVFAVDEAPSGWVWRHQQPLVVHDVEQDSRFPQAMPFLREHGVRSFCSLPLTTAHRRLGALAIAKPERGAYSPSEVAFAQLVAAQVAVAVDNVLSHQEGQALQDQLAREAERLRTSEERWRRVFENSAIGMALTDLHGRFLATNAAYQHMLGYTEEEFRTFSFLDITHEDHHEANWALVTELLEGTRQQFQIEKRYWRKDGTLMWVSNNVSLVPGTERTPRFIMAIVEDITERKRAEEALRKSEEFKGRLVDCSQDCIKVLDLDGRLLSMNEGGMRALEICDLGPFVNSSWIEFWEGEDREAARAAVQAARNDGLSRFIGYFATTMTKQPRWWDVVVSPIRDAEGQPERLLAVSRDVTEHKQNEKALREAHLQVARSEERWRAVYENSAVGIALTDLTGRFLAANAAYQTMLGYTEDELQAVSFMDITHEDHREANRALISELLEGKRQQFQIEKRYWRKDGTLMWVNNTMSLVPGTERTPRFLMAIVEDITERKRLEQALQHERDRLRLLLDLNNTLVSQLDLRELFQSIAASLRRIVPCDFASLALPDVASGQLRLHGLDSPEGRGFFQEEMVIPVQGSASGLAFRTGKPLALNSFAQARRDPEIYGAPGAEEFYQRVAAEGFTSGCFLPLLSRGRVLGVLSLSTRQEHTFRPDEVAFLGQVASQVAIAVENALDYRHVTASQERLAEETRYLQEELRTAHNFDTILGDSAALQGVLQQVEMVAPTDATVLILGETGTGKELIARAIHALSARRDHTLVKVNCAAIPSGLLESELFGHEKGAFTGAIARKIGRFELAHQGTLLLDEVGDLPLDLQPKLLRVLQEQAFERVGGTRTIRVNVRLVAATSQDLPQMVEDRAFRGDLYYRLNVFPLTVPPLRERSEDIPLLVWHFVQQYGRRMNQHIDTIPAEAMAALTRYPWPGNVRELQNVIERAVILSPGTVLQLPLAALQRSAARAPARVSTLAEAERAQILQALQDAKWLIGGPQGAAARLGVKRSTLYAKMAKLGISRRPE